MSGTSIEATVDRVVDGDTVRVFLPGREESESVRILALDTEEVFAGTKPVTPLGRRASERAKELIGPGDRLRLIFPGQDPVEQAMRRYRGNFGRLLVYVELPDGRDFQEIMIREGLSPYFQKYGFAHFATLHQRYAAAERAAQAAHLGVWDQIGNNGAEMRNYAALTTWWELRARIIEGFREIRRRAPEAGIWDTRIDYDRLYEIARAGQETTVFTELRSFSPAGADHMVFRSGSREQPFQVFIPDANVGANQGILRLLMSRYISESDERPRRSYAYITGPTKLFPPDTGTPEIVVTDIGQIADFPSSALERALATDGAPGAPQS